MPFFGANGRLRGIKFRKRKPLNRRSLNEWEIKFLPIFHNYIHRCSQPWARNSSSVSRNQVSILTPEDPSGMVRIRLRTQCQISPVLRFRRNGQADEWRIQLPQPAALFLELDLPEIGRNARFLYLPRSP
jgi:hypothetical protein